MSRRRRDARAYLFCASTCVRVSESASRRENFQAVGVCCFRRWLGNRWTGPRARCGRGSRTNRLGSWMTPRMMNRRRSERKRAVILRCVPLTTPGEIPLQRCGIFRACRGCASGAKFSEPRSATRRARLWLTAAAAPSRRDSLARDISRAGMMACSLPFLSRTHRTEQPLSPLFRGV